MNASLQFEYEDSELTSSRRARGDYKGFDYYKESFMKLMKDDILQTFDDFLSRGNLASHIERTGVHQKSGHLMSTSELASHFLT